VHRLLLLSLIIAVFGCRRGQSSGAGGVSRVRVQLNWVPEPEFGGLYAARESGAYTRAGLEVEVVGGAAGTPVLQMVGSGQADFGVVGADDVVLARARGVDVVAVFASFQHSPLGVMTHAKKGYAKLEDLRSGTLAIEPGLPFGAWLKQKYTFPGVTLVPYDGGIAKFLADPNYAQQCYVTSEPIEARKKGAETKVFSARETGFDPYANVVIVRGELLRTKRALVRSFVSASAEGWRSYLADPAAANAAMARLNTAMDRATFDEVAKVQEPLVRGELAPDALGSMGAARFTELGAQLVEIGTISAAPRAEECFAAP